MTIYFRLNGCSSEFFEVILPNSIRHALVMARPYFVLHIVSCLGEYIGAFIYIHRYSFSPLELYKINHLG